MNPLRLLLTVRRNYVDHGLGNTLIKIIKTLISPVYENYTYRIYCRELSEVKQSAVNHQQHIIVGLANCEDTDVIRQIETIAEWLQGKIKDKLAQNHLCVVALDGKKLAGFNLISLEYGHIPLLRLEWQLDEDEAWSEQITVDKAYRRQGLGLALRTRAFKELRALGISRFCGGALRSNQTSLKLAQKAGYQFTEDIQYIKILGHKKWHRREVEK